MVKLAGSHEFDAPRDAVWDALLDPDVLSRILPGCQRLDRTAQDEFSGQIIIRVGPVQGSFNGKVTLADVDPPNGYRMELSGQGRPGFVKGAGALRLEGDAPTTLHYDGDAQLSGRIASVGQRLVDSTARSLTRQGLQSLEKIIAARLQPPDPAPSQRPAATEAEPAHDAAPAPANAAQPDSDPHAARAPAPSEQPQTAAPSTVEVGINVAKDVVTDLAQDFRLDASARKVLYILAGFAAIVWMWRLLFNRD